MYVVLGVVVVVVVCFCLSPFYSNSCNEKLQPKPKDHPGTYSPICVAGIDGTNTFIAHHSSHIIDKVANPKSKFFKRYCIGKVGFAIYCVHLTLRICVEIILPHFGRA